MFDLDKFEDLICSIVGDGGRSGMTREEVLAQLIDILNIKQKGR